MLSVGTNAVAVPGGQSLGSPAGIDAIAHLVSALAWPAIALCALLVFRRPLMNILPKIREIEVAGVKAKIEGELVQAEQNAASLSGKSGAPSPSELQQARSVEELTEPSDMGFVRAQAEALAAEYEKVRSSMRSSDARTREMEKVVAKMRVLGRAAFGLRHEFSVSPSPGLRLQAVAILQVLPDPEYLDWLVDRVATEPPFVGYHAAVALLVAAGDQQAADWIAPLQRAADHSRNLAYSISQDSDRQKRMEEFRQRVATLSAAPAA